MPPRENWPWEEKVRKNTENKLFSDEYHGVNCSLPSQSQTLLFRADHAASASRVLWSKRLGYVTVRGELTETAWENAVKSCSQVLCSKHADAQTALFKFHRYVFENVKCTVVCVLGGGGERGRWGRRTRLCKFVCFLDSTKSNPTVCKRFPLFLFHPFRSIILPLPHKTHLHFTKILKKS